MQGEFEQSVKGEFDNRQLRERNLTSTDHHSRLSPFKSAIMLDHIFLSQNSNLYHTRVKVWRGYRPDKRESDSVPGMARAVSLDLKAGCTGRTFWRWRYDCYQQQ